MEILGKTRPPGDSVESLALAHLCDGSNEDVSPKIHCQGKGNKIPRTKKKIEKNRL